VCLFAVPAKSLCLLTACIPLPTPFAMTYRRLAWTQPSFQAYHSWWVQHLLPTSTLPVPTSVNIETVHAHAAPPRPLEPPCRRLAWTQLSCQACQSWWVQHVLPTSPLQVLVLLRVCVRWTKLWGMPTNWPACPTSAAWQVCGGGGTVCGGGGGGGLEGVRGWGMRGRGVAVYIFTTGPGAITSLCSLDQTVGDANQLACLSHLSSLAGVC
jgi:hypothetical protein